jgi:ABC-2 type transport system permease protein
MPDVADLAVARRESPVATTAQPGLVAARFVAARAARSGAIWGLVFGVYVAGSATGFASLYKTQVARENLARTFGSNFGITALIGPARSIDTVAGFTAWRSLGVLSLVGAVWGLMTATRLMRGDEEAGRWELLLAGLTTRRRAAAQALLGLGVGLVALFAVTALLTIATGSLRKVDFAVGSALYFAATLVAAVAMFLGVGALTSQLAATRWRAASIGGAVLGVAYALRMVADSDPSLHWAVWLSPLGWVEETRPLTDPHPLALVPVVGLVAVTCVATVWLAGSRDLGAAVLPDSQTSAPRLALLGGPTGLAIRSGLPVTLGWLSGIAAYSLVIGLVADAGQEATSSANGLQAVIARLGGRGAAVDAYLGLTFLIVAVFVAFAAAGQAVAARTEEAEGRLENLLALPVSRTAWLGGRLVVAVVFVVATGIVAGASAWLGAATQHTGVEFGSLVNAGLNVVPPALFILGLGLFVLGGWPRQVATVLYGYLAWSFLVEIIGGIIHLDHWFMDTSVFFHMVPAPATAPNWTSAGVMVGVAALAAAAGFVLLARRDVAGA